MGGAVLPTGHHYMADLQGCRPELPFMTEPQALRELCLQAVCAAGLTPVGELFHAFAAPGGVTGMVLLAESHLAVHTWPERGVVTLDVFVCNLVRDNAAAARALLDDLVSAFQPLQQHLQHCLRPVLMTG
jgi:S-adenosylmethionine decarboxylase